MKKTTFTEKLYECNQHKKRLLKSKEYLKDKMPLSLDSYLKLDEISLSFIDQMIFRFSKLQDTLGEKLFPLILEFTGEDIKKMTFIDRLNRLEELGLVNKNEWMSLRKERNEIAHEYSFNQDEIVDSINIIYERADELLKIYETVYSFCLKNFDFIDKKKLS